ncbi:helix-turn-helix domain-containing protein [Cronobacter malonaticus]|jgi:DNA-binding transcriptional regulator YdaS (Cro superfamily)|uniref:transcriptional regulator n=1 Tax=Cronobacter malonaticus TaxID=413503 RepID=UPI0005180559|nr:YdaS family helix-turn-helix protein [Cronobacter malonaticus]ALX77773.1 Cro/Cl family transcriptional regulator [Cronobacter malonaticus LMG 23826]ELY6230515.1 helix-turn-helix domain-containing protein [Cronobacter malonaticus]
MEELRKYLNSLSLDEQRKFAADCGTTIGYMRKALSRNHDLGAALCVLIEKASNGAVTRKDLHPSDWVSIWPELTEKAA